MMATTTKKVKSASAAIAKPVKPVKAPAAKKPPAKKAATRNSSPSKTAIGSDSASAIGPDARTLVDWLKTDDKKLLTGIEAQLDVFQLSEILHREPTSVLRHLDEVGLFEFDMHSEEQVEIFDLAFSGVPLQVAIRWCEGDDQRLLWSEIEAMRKQPSMRSELEFARENRMWSVTPSSMEALAWCMTQPMDKVAESILGIQARFDALTPQCLKNQINGVVPVRHAPSFGSWSAKAAGSGFAAASVATASDSGYSASVASRYPKTTSGTKSKSGYKKSRYGKSTSSGGYKKSRYAKRGPSASVASGAPCADTRTTAEKAWENLTHW